MLDAIKILDEAMVKVGAYTNPQVYLYDGGSRYGLVWLVLWHAECYLHGNGGIYREQQGSAVRALLFPNFPQKQIKHIKEDK